MSQTNTERATFLSAVLDDTKVDVTSWRTFQDAVEMVVAHRGQWCFRGQTKAHWDLSPSLERLVGEGRRPEIKRVERALLARFRRQAHHYLSTTPNEQNTLEWLALMQHWGAPTRLLDFTLSPYVGLYFALVGMEETTSDPAAVYSIRYTWLTAIASESLHGKTIAEVLPTWTSGERQGPLKFHNLFDAAFQKQIDLDFVAPVQPVLLNERLAVQQGMFLCPFTLGTNFEMALIAPNIGPIIDEERSEIKRDFAFKLIISPNARSELLWNLQRMNITAVSLFPGLQGFSQSLREAYEALGGSNLERGSQIDALEDFGWAL